MKPRILHLLNDHSVGGITATIRSLSNSRLNQVFDFKLIKPDKVLSAVRFERPDVVIFHDPSSWQHLLCLALLKIHGRKVIVHEHHYSAGFEQYNVSDPARFRSMLKLAYHLADQVVAVSHAQEIWMQQNRLVFPKKLTMIRQCRILDDFSTLPFKVIQQPLVLAAYGRFCTQKGFDTLLQAIQLISEVDIILHIGGYGEDEALLKQMAQRQKNITFWDAIHDVPAFLSGADIVVIPSRWEPWGNVCTEAKAAGKPIIASDVDGLSEQVQNCGILVTPDDPMQLANAIRSIATLPAQSLKTWGEAGRESVKDCWNTYLNQWETLLWRIIDS